MKMIKILAFIIAFAMCFSVFPAQIFAVDYDGVEFTALDGTGNNGESQNYAKLIDGTTSTKWCDRVGTTSSTTYIPYIIFKASKKVIITDYTFITGNDTATQTLRNPKDWTLYGCNDYDEENLTGGTWTAIHTVTDDDTMPAENYVSCNFTIDDNNEMYQYYKLEITANHGTSLMQLSEMEIKWTVAYNITFDKNGGDTEASPQIIKWGEGLPTTNPTRTDYKFLGWYTKDGTDGDWGEEFTADSTVSDDITVYAKWERLYWVTFDLNGGTAESIDKIYHGEPLPTEIPTKEDVKFGGWFTKNGMETGDWGEQYSLDTVVTEDITVYAKWIVDVTLTALDGTSGVNTNENYDKLFDGDTGTKWCFYCKGSAYVVFKASEIVKLSKYSIATASDTSIYYKRNPKAWKLYACKEYAGENTSWILIDTVTDSGLPSKNNTYTDFTLA
ncbi:MAG: InlB B-repeat-containing protein, partial [Lachnospirales bacterium]